jgi:hypothetical protein
MWTKRQFSNQTEEAFLFENLTSVSLTSSQMFHIRGGNSDSDDDGTAHPNDADDQEDGFN